MFIPGYIPVFHQLIDDLRISAPDASALPWEVLSGINLMIWSCIHRRNVFRAQGVLGAVELLAPQRCTRVVHGATRLGIRKKTVVYYGAHAIIDVGHAEGVRLIASFARENKRAASRRSRRQSGADVADGVSGGHICVIPAEEVRL